MDPKTFPTKLLFPLPKAKIGAFVDSYPDGIVFSDTTGNIIYLNQKALEIFGYAAGELIGQPLRMLIPSELHERPTQGLDKLNQTEAAVAAGSKIETRGARKDCTTVPIEISHHKISQGDRQLNFCLINDISRQHELQAQLYQQTITDPLTGLFNRRHFDDRLKQEFTRASRYQRFFSVAIIDIDGFKQANDLFGHAFGDEMLVLATKTFKEVLRDGDTAFRYGGDEFAIIFPETTKEGALEVAERLRDIFAKRTHLRKKRLKLSLSIGLASHPEDGKSDSELIKAADRRMYQSKESGGNAISAYNLGGEHASEDDALIMLLTKLIHLVEKHRHMESPDGLCHSQEIRALGIEIGRKLDLDPHRLHLYEQAAMLHDIGAIHIPNSILNKREKLSPAEIEEIRKHTLIGEEILGLLDTQHNPDLATLQTIVSQHHEWVDGNGYPHGLKGDELLLEAKILAVTDAYSSMKMAHPYRQAMPKAKILSEFRRMAGIQFDAEVVAALIEVTALDEEGADTV